jgi:hypothetical protein
VLAQLEARRGILRLAVAQSAGIHAPTDRPCIENRVRLEDSTARRTASINGGLPLLNFGQIADLNQQERDRWVKSSIERYLETGTRVLDVGAGTSPYREALARQTYIAHQ